MTYSLNDLEYESLRSLALIAAARSGPGDLLKAYQALDAIEERAGAPRSRMVVGWRVPTKDVSLEKFPDDFPKTLVEVRGRALNRNDILEAVKAAGGGAPSLIMVTRDARGLVGWQSLEVAFPQ